MKRESGRIPEQFTVLVDQFPLNGKNSYNSSPLEIIKYPEVGISKKEGIN
jgi:hypothetical protein